MLISNGLTHSNSETLRLVSKERHDSHHFTQPYSSWSELGIERLCKKLLRVFSAKIFELGFEQGKWPDLLSIVQSAINHFPSPQRYGASLIKAMTGLDAWPPMFAFLRFRVQKDREVTELEKER